MEEKSIAEVTNNNPVNLFAFTNIDRAWKFASLLSESAIIPDTFQRNPASCLIALDMANRMKRNPMEVMQAMYIVHGKPGFSSSFLISLINSCGLFERLRFEFVGDVGTPERGCRAWTTEKRTGEKLVGPLITIKMAEEEGWVAKNKKWRTMSDVMLTYRSASFFSRAYCPDLTGGFHSEDELSDADIRSNFVEDTSNQSEAIKAELISETSANPNERLKSLIVDQPNTETHEENKTFVPMSNDDTATSPQVSFENVTSSL